MVVCFCSGAGGNLPGKSAEPPQCGYVAIAGGLMNITGLAARRKRLDLAFPTLSRTAHYGGCVLLIVSAFAYSAWSVLSNFGPVLPDFAAYYAAGQYWAHGGDAYGAGIWNIERTLPGFDPSRLELLPFVGPPLSLPIWAAFGALPYPAAAALWVLVLLVSAAVLVLVPAQLARRRLVRDDAPSIVLLLLSASPLVTAFSAGQAALPAIASVAVAIRCAVLRRWALMAVATIVAAMLKPNDALVIGASVREAAALLAVAGSIIVSVLANLPVVHGIHGLAGYGVVLLNQGASERVYAFQFTPTSIAYGFGLTRQAAELVGTAISLVALVSGVAAIRFTRANVVDGAAIACAFVPFVLPFEHGPDLIVVLLPALLLVFRARGWAWPAGAVGMVLLCTNPFALTQGWQGTLFAVSMAAVASLQLAALAPSRFGRMRFVPLTVVPLLIAIGLAAPRHHLPIWPATLPAHVTVANGASASEVWQAELIASGLENQDPWVSFLRLLTLCGCACVCIAMVRTAARRGDDASERLPGTSVTP
jgi:hypothetical protein